MADSRDYGKRSPKRYWAGDADKDGQMGWQTLDELHEKQQRRIGTTMSPTEWKKEFKRVYDLGRSPARPAHRWDEDPIS